MKSRASCYDQSLARMEMRRFAPLVLLYSLGMGLLILVMVISNDSPEYGRIQDAVDLFRIMWVVNLGYGLVLCQLLFGDLYTPRLCYTIQALPITLGGYFGTQIILGFLASLLPNVCAAVIMAPFLGQYSYIAWWWLECVILQFILCFGVGTVAAIGAGNRVGMVLIYGIIQLYAVLIYWAVDHIYNPLLYGLVPNADFLTSLSPAYRLLEYRPVLVINSNPVGMGIQIESVIKQSFLIYYIYAAVGIVLIALAMVLLRKRKMEVCGDLLAFPKSKPVFLLLFTLAVGVCAHIVSDGTETKMSYLFLGVGLVVGFFAGTMLLERQIQVFTKKNFKILSGICGAVFLSLLLTGLDLFGQVNKLPQEVESASLRSIYDNTVSVDSEEEIQAIQQIHRIILDEYQQEQAHYSALERIFRSKEQPEVIYSSDGPSVEYTLFVFDFTLKDGSTMRRQYNIGEASAAFPLMRKVLSAPKYTLWSETMTPEKIIANTNLLSLNCSHPFEYKGGEKLYLNTEDGSNRYTYSSQPPRYMEEKDDILGFYEAYLKDCAAGTTAKYWIFGRFTKDYIDVAYLDDGTKKYMSLPIHEDCVNTRAWLFEHGYHDIQ